jgi:hypothetical protein
MMGIQSIHPQPKEARLPADGGRCRGSKLLLDHAESGTFGQHQDQAGAKHISGGQRTRLRNAAQFLALLFAQQHFRSPHDYLDVNCITNVYLATGH